MNVETYTLNQLAQNIVNSEFNGTNKIAMINMLRQVTGGSGLKECKYAIDDAIVQYDAKKRLAEKEVAVSQMLMAVLERYTYYSSDAADDVINMLKTEGLL
jgi:ribosomal protein L7/L12